MQLSLEECKKIHTEMWNFIKKTTISNSCDTVMIRYQAKKYFCKMHHYDLLNNCALCEYAHNICPDNYCSHCPALWGTEDFLTDFFCDDESSDEILCWQFGNLDDIINIKWKEEEE